MKPKTDIALNGTPRTLRDYAQIGLLQRLAELDQERARILALMEKPGTGKGTRQGTEKVRQILRQHWTQTRAGQKRLAENARQQWAKARKGGAKKGHRYRNGTHWMQRPENRAKVMARVRKLHEARAAQAKEARG